MKLSFGSHLVVQRILVMKKEVSHNNAIPSPMCSVGSLEFPKNYPHHFDPGIMLKIDHALFSTRDHGKITDFL